jgi:hypothetical protein
MADKITFEYVAQKNDEFNLAMGRAIARWSNIELGLCRWFKRITKMSHATARAIFYSASGFDGRRRMFVAALGSAKMDAALRDYLNLLVQKAGNYSGSRNKLAHGDPLFVRLPKSRHYGTIIILEGKEARKLLPSNDAILTLENIETMTENFRFLGALIADSLNWDEDASQHPSRWSPQARALPNPAHSGQLDPTIAKQLRSQLKHQFGSGR